MPDVIDTYRNYTITIPIASRETTVLLGLDLNSNPNPVAPSIVLTDDDDDDDDRKQAASSERVFFLISLLCVLLLVLLITLK